MSDKNDETATEHETVTDSEAASVTGTEDSSMTEDPIRDAARQLSIILVRRGISCRLVTAHGMSLNTVLRLSMTEKILSIFWRSSPEKLGCELIFLKEVVRGVVITDPDIKKRLIPKKCLGLVFSELSLQLETVDEETCEALHLCLETLLLETKNAEKDRYQGSLMLALRKCGYHIAIRQELQYQSMLQLKGREGALIVDKILNRMYYSTLKYGFMMWTEHLKELNSEKMILDKTRWRLHAASNMDLDLQAWYHTVFYHEVYRLRGPFWYREAVLPGYRRSYDLVDNALTPLEEAQLAHVLCSPDTTYGDVAGQMYVVQEIVSPDQFELFQTLAAKGITVTKYPRTGRPAKKMFRFSFVEGNIYLTWKGKFGNQGVDLHDVSSVTSGLVSEVLKKTGRSEKAENYLSVNSVGRSVDLFFDASEERARWNELLGILQLKEQGFLVDMEMMESEADAPEFDGLVLYASLGKGIAGARNKGIPPVFEIK
mmetsp:Transcript_35159/g.35800  ORF Transcript_35159/g.35800 Transcript_35159/m.35800 type:complete len:486 (-) Transcript_35159:79-1536(-)|eukprot:CAMPEP_0182416754 /NCGR_PEP_ID=MMETSP1167-20130531/1111_1 /TAXON_ID=2988 /ORGANISM="Mallomonas Sp, Strain CCMP3275" /LENGTH=485 /DNA_ID=CAMNT_0024589795 /DNA_START=124 /DNA_END=1581 /DNA_ORIENTATION=+